MHDKTVGVVKELIPGSKFYGRCRKVLYVESDASANRSQIRALGGLAAEAGASRMAHISTIEIRNLEESFCRSDRKVLTDSSLTVPTTRVGSLTRGS